MTMDRTRLELPSAVLAAVAAAEAGVLLLRPREDPIAPAPVLERDHFSAEEIERAKAYRRPQRALALAGMALDTAALTALAVRPPALLRRRRRRPVAAAAATGAALAAGLTVAGLPLSALSRRRSMQVGLATQSWPAWGADVAKATAIGAAFSAGGGAAGVALMRRLPRAWWAPGAGVAIGFGVLTTWLGPVVLDPIFNRFTPLPDGEARSDVLELAERAGVEVGEVYEVDASRRTTAANAYVNGIGATKRVVLFDTLLRDFSRDEVRLVVAHELGHVRHRDVPRLLAFLAVAAPAAMLATAHATRRLLPDDEPAGPQAVPAVALAAMLVGAPVSTVLNQLSRRIEARTDEFALRLTGAPEPFIAFERGITIKNVAEADPPRWARLLFGSHPTTLERIGAAIAFRDAAARPAAR
jgi:STE24 endopeptidase